jgi:hypothetical protein
MSEASASAEAESNEVLKPFDSLRSLRAFDSAAEGLGLP